MFLLEQGISQEQVTVTRYVFYALMGGGHEAATIAY